MRENQPKEWDKLVTKHGATNAEENFLKRFYKDLDTHGMLHILRKGIVDAPAKFNLVFFQPASGMNKTDADNYKKTFCP